MPDSRGKLYGDPGYDQSTDTDFYTPYYKETIGNDIQTSIDDYAEKFARERQDEIDAMKPIPKMMDSPDFSSAPGWWNKGGSQIQPQQPQQPQSPMLPQSPAQAAPQLPAYSPTPSNGGGRMIDYIGNVGGKTGIIATSPLASALRGTTGGQSNGR